MSSTKSTFIVNSVNLRRSLKMAAIGCAQEFRLNPEGPGIAIGNYPVGGVCKGFSDFDLPYEKVVKLLTVLQAIEEQPIACSWDGNWITIKEIVL